jgi:hypothetical protein
VGSGLPAEELAGDEDGDPDASGDGRYRGHQQGSGAGEPDGCDGEREPGHPEQGHRPGRCRQSGHEVQVAEGDHGDGDAAETHRPPPAERA